MNALDSANAEKQRINSKILHLLERDRSPRDLPSAQTAVRFVAHFNQEAKERQEWIILP
ncbi:MAG TPA: hypothetical protein VE860_03010 [Chthoniobacterales bacterium]|jgi:hypothetical protein|nr:hypothetical protein [Chthoniobacterales bacterium]